MVDTTDSRLQCFEADALSSFVINELMIGFNSPFYLILLIVKLFLLHSPFLIFLFLPSGNSQMSFVTKDMPVLRSQFELSVFKLTPLALD